jgi:hypothetical protein
MRRKRLILMFVVLTTLLLGRTEAQAQICWQPWCEDCMWYGPFDTFICQILDMRNGWCDCFVSEDGYGCGTVDGCFYI